MVQFLFIKFATFYLKNIIFIIYLIYKYLYLYVISFKSV